MWESTRRDYLILKIMMIAGPLLGIGMVVALLVWRPVLEPLLKPLGLAFVIWASAKSGGGAYLGSDFPYLMWIGFALMLGLVSFICGLSGLLSKPETDRRLDNYLRQQAEDRDRSHHGKR